MSFRNCVSSCLRWEGAAPGDVSEENLAKLAEEAKARIEGRERRNAALARRGTVVSLSEQSARVAPEEGAGESKGDT